MQADAGRWEVVIQGDAFDLEHLVRHFVDGPVTVRKDSVDGAYLLVADDFGGLANPQDVRRVADEQLAVLSGVLKVAHESREPVRSAAVYWRRPDGSRDIFVLLEGGQIHVRSGDLTAVVTTPDGTVVSRSGPPRTVALLRLALKDKAVAKVLRLSAAEDSGTWGGLYRILDVVRADVGGKEAFLRRGWGSSKDHKRFTWSADNPKVSGDAARHGESKDPRPLNPMTLTEATAYVKYVLNAWLAAKGV